MAASSAFELMVLQKASAIKAKYEKVNELNATQFNIFKILSLENDERYTHSAFLAELLNPNGSHGQGDTFLKLFLTSLKDQLGEVITCEDHVWIKTELFAQNSESQGYIDIWLETPFGIIAIENKIFAQDQPRQIERYDRYIRGIGKNYKIIYLTRYGVDASEQSIGEVPIENLGNLSYKNHIVSWLELCLKEVARKAVIRETIYQYIQLCKALCGIPLNENEEMELNDLLKIDFKHFEAANNIHVQFKKSKYEIKYKFWEEVRKNIESKLDPSKWKVDDQLYFDEGQSWPGITVRLTNYVHPVLGFRIEKLQDKAFYGIGKHDWKELPENKKEVLNRYAHEFNVKMFANNQYWVWWELISRNLDFSDIQILKRTFNEDEKQDLINDISAKFIGLVEHNEVVFEKIVKESQP